MIVRRHKAEKMPQLRLLYDAKCPFCRREALWLKARDSRNRIMLVDISSPQFDAAAYGLDASEVKKVLHAIVPDGTVVSGLDAIQEVYRAVGLSWVVAPLSWPGIRHISNLAYRLFARYRVTLGRLLGSNCDHAASCSANRVV